VAKNTKIANTFDLKLFSPMARSLIRMISHQSLLLTHRDNQIYLVP
jgi:hypothetical protein